MGHDDSIEDRLTEEAAKNNGVAICDGEVVYFPWLDPNFVEQEEQTYPYMEAHPYLHYILVTGQVAQKYREMGFYALLQYVGERRLERMKLDCQPSMVYGFVLREIGLLAARFFIVGEALAYNIL